MRLRGVLAPRVRRVPETTFVHEARTDHIDQMERIGAPNLGLLQVLNEPAP